MITNDELYKKYEKLVYHIIHRWSTKPNNYKEYFYDIAGDAFIKLFQIPVNGTRRENPSYVNTIIQTSIANSMNRLKKINHNEELPCLDEELSNTDLNEKEFELFLDQIYTNLLDLNEKIVIAAYLDMGYKRKCYVLRDIAKMIYKSKEDTEIVLNNALDKIKAAITSKCDIIIE